MYGIHVAWTSVYVIFGVILFHSNTSNTMYRHMQFELPAVFRKNRSLRSSALNFSKIYITSNIITSPDFTLPTVSFCMLNCKKATTVRK
eukprot:m.406340 g.406340  ORF g.406340 m.406340 type:complete len:89 (+) comp21213_c0_seq27:1961-2227(+)